MKSLVLIFIFVTSFTLFAQDQYCNGQAKNKWGDSYYPNGQVVEKYGDYFYPNGQMIERYGDYFFPNGTMAEKYGDFFYPNGQIITRYGDKFYPNGQIVEKCGDFFYPNGQIIEQYGEHYYPNGQIIYYRGAKIVRINYKFEGFQMRANLNLLTDKLEGIKILIVNKDNVQTSFKVDLFSDSSLLFPYDFKFKLMKENYSIKFSIQHLNGARASEVPQDIKADCK